MLGPRGGLARWVGPGGRRGAGAGWRGEAVGLCRRCGGRSLPTAWWCSGPPLSAVWVVIAAETADKDEAL
jgi:hypothetical protein